MEALCRLNPTSVCIAAHSYSSSSSFSKCRIICHSCRNYHMNYSIEFRLPPTRTPNSKSLKNNTTASNILHLLDVLSLAIPSDMYISLIKECTKKKDSTRALEVHGHIKKRRNLRPTLIFLNRLLLMNVSCGQNCIARQLFDEMPFKDFNSWAIMIVGYIDVADYQESINLFVEMTKEKQQSKTSHLLLEFPAWIIICIFNACVCTMNMELGKQLHGLLFKLGSSSDISLAGSLINFYGKFRCLEDANFVFSQLRRRNTVVWTAKIVNNCREGHFREVFDDFNEMGREGIKKNSYTFSSVLKACGMVHDDGNCGQQVHANAIKIGLESDAYVQCGLVDMYGKCGLLKEAERVFKLIVNNRNIAAWNAMLMGYVRNGFYIGAIKFLYQMKASGIVIQESLIKYVRLACVSDGNTLQNRMEQTVTTCT